MADQEQPRDQEKSMAAEPPDSLSLPIEWHVGEGIVSRYSNHVLVQQGKYECGISFFEIKLPILIGPPQEVKEQLEQVKTIRAECVARIIVAHDLLPDLIDALQEVNDKLMHSKDKEKGKVK